MNRIINVFSGLGRTARTVLVALAVVFVSAGIAQAASVISTNLQTDGTLSVTGISTLTGNVSAAGTLGVTGLSSLGSASSTQLSANTAYFGQTATSTFNSAGALTLASPLAGTSGGTGISFFTAAGPTAARTYTFPDASATIARTDAAQTLTGIQTMGGFISTASSTVNSNLVVTSTLNKGTATMTNGANSAVTVAAGSICTVTDNTNATSTKASVSGTTLTINVGSPTSLGNSDVVSYLCF